MQNQRHAVIGRTLGSFSPMREAIFVRGSKDLSRLNPVTGNHRIVGGTDLTHSPASTQQRFIKSCQT